MKVSTVHSSRNDILIVFQNDKHASHVKIRGLEINGKLVTYKEGKIEYSQNLSIKERIPDSTTSDPSIIPLGAVHSSIDSPFSTIFLNTNHIVSISLLSLSVLMTIAVCGVFRYLRLQEAGSYYTQEEVGDTIAVDADTAVLQARTGCRVERRKEWVL